MSKRSNLVGQRFGRLLVVAMAGVNAKGNTTWACVCDCGGKKTALSGNLRHGGTTSCGCFHAEGVAARNIARERTHGMSRGGGIYRIWSGIMTRCRNPNSKDWPRYGGRGIAVCERWNSYEAFHADMGARPSARHSVERKDTNGNYEPDNCCWALPKVQSNNRRDNIFVTHLGITKTLAEWADAVGLKRPTVYWRYNRGWRGERLLQAPLF